MATPQDYDLIWVGGGFGVLGFGVVCVCFGGFFGGCFWVFFGCVFSFFFFCCYKRQKSVPYPRLIQDLPVICKMPRSVTRSRSDCRRSIEVCL